MNIFILFSDVSSCTVMAYLPEGSALSVLRMEPFGLIVRDVQPEGVGEKSPMDNTSIFVCIRGGVGCLAPIG